MYQVYFEALVSFLTTVPGITEKSGGMIEEKCLDVVLKGVGWTFLTVEWLRIHLQCGRPGFDRSLGGEDSPGGGHGKPLRYSCLENPVGRGAWGARVHGLALDSL